VADNCGDGLVVDSGDAVGTVVALLEADAAFRVGPVDRGAGEYGEVVSSVRGVVGVTMPEHAATRSATANNA
jgi:hypothetical protein